MTEAAVEALHSTGPLLERSPTLVMPAAKEADSSWGDRVAHSMGDTRPQREGANLSQQVPPLR